MAAVQKMPILRVVNLDSAMAEMANIGYILHWDFNIAKPSQLITLIKKTTIGSSMFSYFSVHMY
jgi:hypothetical protein